MILICGHEESSLKSIPLDILDTITDAPFRKTWLTNMESAVVPASLRRLSRVISLRMARRIVLPGEGPRTFFVRARVPMPFSLCYVFLSMARHVL